MGPDVVRTSIDVPRGLHRQLHQAAARRGCSARKLVLDAIERVVAESGGRRPRRRLKLDPPLIPPAGRKLRDLDEDAYELLELP